MGNGQLDESLGFKKFFHVLFCRASFGIFMLRVNQGGRRPLPLKANAGPAVQSYAARWLRGR